MKKNTFTYLLMCGLCIFLLSACFGFHTGDEVRRIRSYVVAFGEPTAFQLQLTDKNNIVLYWSNFSRWVTFQDVGYRGRRYDELATQYNDLGYNRRTRFIGFPDGRSYVSNGIASIDVVSDTDFDTKHPASTSLANFVRLLSISPIRFIESGYRKTFDWHNNYPTDFLRETATFHRFILREIDGRNLYQNSFPISKLLSELEQSDFRLLGTGDKFYLPSSGSRNWFFGYLVFDKEPENLGTHNLTVTIYRTNGQVLSQTIEKTFGK